MRDRQNTDNLIGLMQWNSDPRSYFSIPADSAPTSVIASVGHQDAAPRLKDLFEHGIC